MPGAIDDPNPRLWQRTPVVQPPVGNMDAARAEAVHPEEGSEEVSTVVWEAC
jgi:hypothetical protein